MAPATGKTFPTFRSFARLNSLHKADETTEFFDCKFYPYTEPGVDPVFAVVGGAETIVCRPSKTDTAAVEVLAWFHEDDANAGMNSCCWSQDLDTGDPLLCVGGQTGGIRVFNVRTKELTRTLIGHGKDINDLAVSPLSPDILASASMDYSVRFWSLDPKHAKQPTMLICGGEGHKEGLLTMAFHRSGRYLLTGGMDSVINLWVIPPLPNELTGTDHPTILHYPHFSSSAIHTNVVDSIAWHHDLIISKSANESKITLWRIENFSSADHNPPRAPTTHEFRPTRSAFGGTYQRLLTFDAAECTPFYMRFGLFPGGSHLIHNRPILAIANEKSRVFFWDLQALEEWDGTDSDPAGADREGGGGRGGRPRGGKRGGRGGAKHSLLALTRERSGDGSRDGDRERESSIASSATNYTRSNQAGASFSASDRLTPSISTVPSGPPLPTSVAKDTHDVSKTAEPQDGTLLAGGEPVAQSKAYRKFSVESPFRPLIPHKTMVVPRVGFTARQVAWSVGGEYMVVVGGQGMVVVFAREGEGEGR